MFVTWDPRVNSFSCYSPPHLCSVGMQLYLMLFWRVAPDQPPLEKNKFSEEKVLKDRKSTRLNSSHKKNSYAVFCLKKKKKHQLTLHNKPTPKNQEKQPKHTNTK